MSPTAPPLGGGERLGAALPDRGCHRTGDEASGMAPSKTQHGIRLVSPQSVPARGRVEVVFEVTIGSGGIAAGGGLRLYPPITTPPHVWSMVRWDLGLATLEGIPDGAELECWIERHDRGMYHETQAELVHVANHDRPLAEDETFRVVLSDCRAQAFAMKASPFYAEFDSKGEGDACYVSTVLPPSEDPVGGRDKTARLKATKPATISVTGAKPHRIALMLPSKPADDGTFWLGVRAEDKYGNVASLPAGHIGLRPSAPGLRMPQTLQHAGGELCRRIEQFGSVQEPGGYWIDVVECPEGITGTSNVITTEIATPVHFGDIHGHTYASDGLGTQEEYFLYARDVAFAELTCLTDHAQFNDTIVELSERFNEPGRFVTLFGREWGDHRGHRNVYGISAEDVAAVNGPNVLELGQGRDVLIVPHHTNAATKNYWPHCDLSYHDEELQRLIEVSQNRGSFEVEDIGGPVVDGGYGASVQSALARGMKLGFVGGSDTHRGTPSGPSHPLDPYYNTWNGISGLSGIPSERLTREDVFDAMKWRRTYCTTGPRIVAEYSVNGHPMGTILPSADRAVISGLIAGTDALVAVEIIKNNEVAYRIEPGERIARFEFMDDAPGNSYYYIRAWQTDGHYVYLSPVWIGE